MVSVAAGLVIQIQCGLGSAAFPELRGERAEKSSKNGRKRVRRFIIAKRGNGKLDIAISAVKPQIDDFYPN